LGGEPPSVTCIIADRQKKGVETMTTSTRTRLVALATLGGAVAFGTAHAATLNNGSFEHGGPAWGRSIELEWGGDPVSFVGPTLGVTPLDGAQMAWFHATNTGDTGNVSSDLWQIVDLTEARDIVAAGQARLSASAFVNRVAGDRQTDTAFAIDVQAFDDTASFLAVGGAGYRAKSTGAIRSDADPETWEEIATGLCLPPDTVFAVVRIRATEDVRNDTRGEELDGHFADAVSVTLEVSDECLCPADVNADGAVDENDYMSVVKALGRGRGSADVDRSGRVGYDDLIEVALVWGGCR
jgi:hypothetical protein